MSGGGGGEACVNPMGGGRGGGGGGGASLGHGPRSKTVIRIWLSFVMRGSLETIFSVLAKHFRDGKNYYPSTVTCILLSFVMRDS